MLHLSDGAFRVLLLAIAASGGRRDVEVSADLLFRSRSRVEAALLELEAAGFVQVQAQAQKRGRFRILLTLACDTSSISTVLGTIVSCTESTTQNPTLNLEVLYSPEYCTTDFLRTYSSSTCRLEHNCNQECDPDVSSTAAVRAGNVDTGGNGGLQLAGGGAGCDGPAPGAVRRVFAHFKARVQPSARVCPASAIAARLLTFREAEVIAAIDHFADDGWCMEHNAQRGAAWFFKSDARVEQYLLMRPQANGNKKNGVYKDLSAKGEGLGRLSETYE